MILYKILSYTVGGTLGAIYDLICCIKDDGLTIFKFNTFTKERETLKNKLLTSYLINENENYAPLIYSMEGMQH